MIKEKKRFRVEEIDGEHYIRVLIHENLSDGEKKHRNSKRLWLKNEQGRRLSLKDYQIKPNRHKRSESEMLKLIEADVEKVYIQYGLQGLLDEDQKKDPHTALKMKIKELFEVYFKHLESTASKRTLVDRENDTLKNYRHALGWYLKVFKNHPADKFPAGVQKDFQTKLAALKIKKGAAKNLAPMTIRKHAIALNGFFRFLSERGLASGPLIILEMPPKCLKPPVRVWSKESSKKMKERLHQMVELYPLEKSQSDCRTPKGRLYLNHLRAWMLLENCGLRLSEVWSLPLENIDVSNAEIRISDIDSDGGRNNRGKKFKIRFRVKGRYGQGRIAYMSQDVVGFLEKDKALRGPRERWFLDRGDGSNLYANPNALGRALERHQEACGIKGEAKRTHSYRATVLTELCRINPYSAQQQAGHADISTTIEAYAAKTPENVKEALNLIKK